MKIKKQSEEYKKWNPSVFTRICRICLIEKEIINNFYLDKKYNCYNYQCRKCLSQKNKENIDTEWKRKYDKEYTLKNKDKKREYDKKYNEQNKEKIKIRGKEWCIKNIEKIKQFRKEYKEKNRLKLRQQSNEYYIKNKKERIEYARIYQKRIHVRIKQAITHSIKKHLNNFRLKKSDKTLNYLGCSLSFFCNYLESKFLPNMSWSNYGKGLDKWVIDHIIPCRYFDLTIPENQTKCFHFSNLQPLWESDNLTKLDRMPDGKLARNINKYENNLQNL